MSEPQPVYTPPTTAGTLTVAPTTDAHLRDLLELKAIAAGTQTEAYVWSKLMKRLGEMIAQRAATLAQERDQAAKGSRTVLEAMVALSRQVFPEGDPEQLFMNWVAENRGRLEIACRDLGIEPPPPGPNLFRRIKELVMPALVAKAKEE